MYKTVLIIIVNIIILITIDADYHRKCCCPSV